MESFVRKVGLEEILSSGEAYHDMVLRCSGDTPGIPVHRLVLAAASPLLSRCLPDSEEGCEVLIPDTLPSQLMHFVQYIYTGVADVSQKEKEDLLELLQRLSVGGEFHRSVKGTSDEPVDNNHKSDDHKDVAKMDMNPDECSVKEEVVEDAANDKENSVEAVSYAAAEMFLQKQEARVKKKKRKNKTPLKTDRWDDEDDDYFGDEDYEGGGYRNFHGVKDEDVNGVDVKAKKPKIEGNWTCSHCSKKFTREQKYQDHLSVHTGEGLKCKFCPKVFERPGLRRVHEQLHTKPFKCDSCDASFGRKSNLIGHQRIHRGERPYICDLCGKGFPIQSSLLTHKKQSHPDTPKPCFCDFCELRFVSKSQLEIHKRSHTGEKPWICDSCGRGFTTKQNMLDHTRLHNDSMDYQCNVCSQRFKWKQSLERHLMDHTGIRPFPCIQCKLTFKTSNSLKKHGLSVHSDIKHFACQYCGSRFSTSSGVLRHQKKQRCSAIKSMTASGTAPPEVNVKPDDRDSDRLGSGKPVKTEPHFNSLPLFLQEAAQSFQNNPGLQQAMLEKGGQQLQQAMLEKGGQQLQQALMGHHAATAGDHQARPLALDRQTLGQLHRPPPLHNRSVHQLGGGGGGRAVHTPDHVTHQMSTSGADGRSQSPADHLSRGGGPPSVESRLTPGGLQHGMVGQAGDMDHGGGGERPIAMTVPRTSMSQMNNYRMME